MTKLIMAELGLATTLVLIITALFVYRLLSKRLKKPKFVLKWRELQLYCRDKSTWPDAISAADKLLDNALKKRRLKGKSMGERLVSAHRLIKDNDDVWDAHQLAKKINQEPTKVRLNEAKVKETLISFREALKDLGALPNDK